MENSVKERRELRALGATSLLLGGAGIGIAIAEKMGDRSDIPERLWNNAEVLNRHLLLHGGLGVPLAIFGLVAVVHAIRSGS